jgi:hypothetical protein
MKMMNRIRAISTEIAAIPVKPKSAATIATMRKVSAQLSILFSHVRFFGVSKH